MARTLFNLDRKGTDIASADEITVPADGDRFDVTGAVTITSILASGREEGARVTFQFDGAPSLTHDAAALIMADGLDYQAAAGDEIVLEHLGSGNWKEVGRRVQVKSKVKRVALTGVRNVDGTTIDATGAATKFKTVVGDAAAGTCVLDGPDVQNDTDATVLMFEWEAPPEYVNGSAITARVSCRATGTGTAGTKTVDLTAHENTNRGASGGDICATAAADLPDVDTWADQDFTITPTNVVAGDKVLFYVTITVQETGDAAALKAQIGDIRLTFQARE